METELLKIVERQIELMEAQMPLKGKKLQEFNTLCKTYNTLSRTRA